jgi:hypothetical protein
VVIEKQRQRQKNSSFIARAVIENNEKFQIIDSLYQEHKELIKQKDVAMTKILKIYNLSFKNFSKKKKIILGHLNGKYYYASPKGIVRPISPRQQRLKQTEDITKSFFSRLPSVNIYKEITEIGLNKEILKTNMNPLQKKIFNGFFKHYKYLKEEPRVVLKIKNPAKVIELTPGFAKPYSFKVFDTISLINNKIGKNEEFDFNFTKDNQLVSTIRFSRLYLASGINEKIFIEQTFCYIKTLLKKEIINRQKEIRRLNIFYMKIKKEFANYILLEKIEEGDK